MQPDVPELVPWFLRVWAEYGSGAASEFILSVATNPQALNHVRVGESLWNRASGRRPSGLIAIKVGRHHVQVAQPPREPNHFFMDGPLLRFDIGFGKLRTGLHGPIVVLDTNNEHLQGAMVTRTFALTWQQLRAACAP